MKQPSRAAALAVCLLAAAATATPTGHAWKTLPVHFSVFSHTQINGIPDFQQTALPAALRGIRHWNAANVSCTRWQSTDDGPFSLPTGHAAINPNDKRNLIIWLGGTDWTHDDATLALTSASYYPGTGELFDADIELNNNRVWKVGGQAQAIDVESILTHELGHFLGLDHSPNTSAIMYADYAIGDVKVTLTPSDVNDVCTVYPASGGGGALGSFCTTDANCGASAPACRRPVGSANAGICTTVCTSSTDACANGNYTCQDASPTGKACLVKPGVPDLCHFCAGSAECLTGRCVSDGQRNWCTTLCTAPSDCGAGYDCVAAGTFKVCAPSGVPAQCPASQCAGGADCAPGYNCQNGMCTASGNPGDRCEVSNYCRTCSVCVGGVADAYCRTCCGGQGAGGVCTTCTSGPASCGTNQGCASLATVDKACVPTVAAASCQFCDNTTPCQAGLQCVGARCHAPCNPLHPGNCNACYPVGSGAGFCGCADETATTGQLCDPPPGGFLACVNGNACVGTPKTCRSRCTVGDEFGCPTGDHCLVVSGQSVCIPPADLPGQRCNTGQGTTCNPDSCAPGLICYSNRCYERCDPIAPACGGCVKISPNDAVCACDDQRVNSGQTCGAAQNGVAACNGGLACTADIAGTCRPTCDPAAPHCNAGESCQKTGGGYVCLSRGDGGTPGPDAGSPDGGTGNKPPTGCGCGSTGPLAAWPLFALAFGLLLRQRARRG